MFHKRLLKQLDYKVLHKGHFVSFKWNNNKINLRRKNTSQTRAFEVNLIFVCPVDSRSFVNSVKELVPQNRVAFLMTMMENFLCHDKPMPSNNS